jgi:TetR/AcrR family transcriptional regulator
MPRKTAAITKADKRSEPSKPIGARTRSKRREQQRAKDTRLNILTHALAEFAERGFDGAVVRNIADRAAIRHPLITYHFKTKEQLWQAVAQHVWTTMRELMDANAPDDLPLSPRDRVRQEMKQLFRLTIMYPDFHHFMLRESRPSNPRLTWLAENVQRPVYQRVVAHIRAAQEVGDMPQGDPTLVDYLMVGMISALTSLGDEIRVLSGLDTKSEEVIEAYWRLIEQVMFPKPFGR